jgi:hypothetical protein
LICLNTTFLELFCWLPAKRKELFCW